MFMYKNMYFMFVSWKFARKLVFRFRIDNNTDMFRQLLVLSDPVIALRIGFQKKKISDYTEELENLLFLDGSDYDDV